MEIYIYPIIHKNEIVQYIKTKNRQHGREKMNANLIGQVENISLDLVRLNVPLKLNIPIKIHYETESPYSVESPKCL